MHCIVKTSSSGRACTATCYRWSIQIKRPESADQDRFTLPVPDAAHNVCVCIDFRSLQRAGQSTEADFCTSDLTCSSTNRHYTSHNICPLYLSIYVYEERFILRYITELFAVHKACVLWPAPNYTARWQRSVSANDLCRVTRYTVLQPQDWNKLLLLLLLLLVLLLESQCHSDLYRGVDLL